MASELYNNISDTNKLEKQFLFYSSFLLVFENLVSVWKQGICFLYLQDLEAVNNDSDEFITQTRFVLTCRDTFFNQFRKFITPEIKKRLNNEVYKTKNSRNKQRPEPLSIFRWMLRKGFICLNDYKILYKCHSKRNSYAHEIDRCLRTSISEEDKQLLRDMINISERASQKWVYRVTIPSNKENQHLVDYVDSAGNKIDPKPEDLLTGTSIFYSLVLSNLETIW